MNTTPANAFTVDLEDWYQGLEIDMDDWKGYLRGKIPMGELQPVQMCASLEQVAEVMQNGLPKGANLDDDLSEMDRLADML